MSATRTSKPARPPRRRAYRHVERVEVYLWDELAGAVALDESFGFYAFNWSPALRASGVEPSPFAMPTTNPGPFVFTDLPEATYKRLPAMLSDALPDDFGNALIDAWMADQGIAPEAVTPLDRLAYMNSRSMGALTFRPSRGSHARTPTAIQMSDLVEEARRAVHGTAGDDDAARAALRSIIDVGTSAGGARAKAVIAWNPVTQEILSGQLDAPDGFEHWLLKFDGIREGDRYPGESQPYGRIEYAYHLMAVQAGIQMSPCRLLEENGRAHFMTQRFDRAAGNVRHHMQTLCAMRHLDYRKKGTNAYSQLFAVIRDLDMPYEDREEAFRRMVFNVMARNCDDHTKNFSFRMRRGHPWELAPAYDVTFAHNPTGEWTSEHLMSVNGKYRDITADDFYVEADRYAIGSARRVIREVADAVASWKEFAGKAGVPEEEVERIQSSHLLLAAV
jgi:serine/threonine-protein kinase HipA